MEITQEQFDELNQKLAALDAAVKEREAKIERLEVDGILAGEKITDPALVRFLRHEHAQAEVAEGETRPAFADWLKGYKEANASSPLFAVAKPAATTTPPVTPPATPPKAPEQKSPVVTQVKGPTPPAAPPKAPPVDATHQGRTGGEPTALGAMTPAQVANLSKEQVEAFGGWGAILKNTVAPGAENAGGV